MKRRYWLTSVLVLLTALAVWLDPTCVLWGLLRRESFFQHRPTSYWRREAVQFAAAERMALELAALPRSPGPPAVNWLRDLLGMDQPNWQEPAVLAENQPAALAVLVELQQDRDPAVRVQVVNSLIKHLDRDRPTALAALTAALDDTDESVRVTAAAELAARFPESIQPRRGILVAGLRSPHLRVRRLAVGGLADLGPLARDAFPELVAVMKVPSLGVYTDGVRALRALDPQEAERILPLPFVLPVEQ